MSKERKHVRDAIYAHTEIGMYIIDKQYKYRTEHVHDNTLEKIEEVGPFDALKNGIKIGNARKW